MSEQNASTQTQKPLAENQSLRPPSEARDEVGRELGVRRRIYDRWIREGRLSQTEARDQLQRMESAFEYLSRLADLQEDTQQ